MTPRCALSYPRCSAALRAGAIYGPCNGCAPTPPVSAAPEATQAPLVGDPGRPPALPAHDHRRTA